MKIGILTFHRAINYGALLQAYALSTYIRKMGHDVQIIDYWPDCHASCYEIRIIPKVSVVHVRTFLETFLRNIVGYNRKKLRLQRMQSLAKEILGLPDAVLYKKPQELKDLNLDIVVYGSDQIWWKNSLNYGGLIDYAYWGDYVKKNIRKVSYAPSMGGAILNECEAQVITKKLDALSFISVRETEVKDLLSPLTTKDITVVLDPVFLLSKEEWSSLCRKLERKPYLLYYNLMPSKEADLIVKRISKEKKLEIVEITGEVNAFKIGKRYVQTADAIDLISYIKDADFVVTTSFHGTAFSIIFEKQFIALGMGNKTGRVSSLLDMLHIPERLISSLYGMPGAEIDYSNVRFFLASQIRYSKEFLANSTH